MNSLQEDTSQRVHPRSHSKQVAGQNSNPRVDDAKVCAFHHFIPFRSQGAGWARRDLTGKPHGKVIDVGLQSHTEDSNHNSVTNALCGLVQVTQLLCACFIFCEFRITPLSSETVVKTKPVFTTGQGRPLPVTLASYACKFKSQLPLF